MKGVLIFGFAHSYNGYTQLVPSGTALEALVRPLVRAAFRADHPGSVGTDLLRGALFVLARGDKSANQVDFDNAEDEAFYRWIVRHLAKRSGGWLPWCGETPAELAARGVHLGHVRRRDLTAKDRLVCTSFRRSGAAPILKT